MSLEAVRADLARKAPDIPAAGDRNSSLRVAPDRLAALVNATWVDVCEYPSLPA